MLGDGSCALPCYALPAPLGRRSVRPYTVGSWLDSIPATMDQRGGAACHRRLSGSAAGERDPVGVLEKAMQKLHEGKDLLSRGDIERAGLLLEEAISALHGGLSEDAFAGARGSSEWAVMPQTVTREVLAEARFLAGVAAQKQRKWERALSHFQSAMRDCPGVMAKVPAFLYGTATSQAVLGDLDAALKNFRAYEKAIKKGNFASSPVQRMMLSFNIGQTLVRMQRDEEARQAFQDVFARSGSSKGGGPHEEKER
jgi:tetratricopeptide (TPR) repeat protein